MNIRNIFILRFLAAMLLCVAAASCSQDELNADRGEALPPGKYPLLFTASIDEMTSRADQSDPWGDGDVIAVQIGEYPKTGEYKLNVDGTVKESDNPLSWPYENGFVKAWYPYVDVADKIETNITDQTEGYHHIDFLYAITDKEENFTNTVNLRFHHQMAKVSCRLTRGEGVTDEDMATAKVSFSGTTSVSFKEGTVAGTDFEWITPLSNESALLVPQDMSGKEFIKVDMTVTVNGVEIPKTLIYSPSEANLKAGTHYVYNITVNKDRLVVDPITAAWDDNVESGDANVAVFKVIMPADLPADSRTGLTLSDNVRNKKQYLDGDVSYLEVEGNKFTIKYPAEAKTLLDFSIVKGSEKDKSIDEVKIPTEELEIGKDLKYEISFNLRSRQVELAWDYLTFDPEEGDFYYSDGTWSRFLYTNKTCIGIVLVTGDDGNNEENGWLESGEKIKGYVVSLTEEAVTWCDETVIPNYSLMTGNGTSTTVLGNFGYARTLNIIEKTAPTITAANKARAWKDKAPESSSGWYLPSANKLKNIITKYKVINESLGKCTEAGVEAAPILTNRYWSNNTVNSQNIYGVYRTTTTTTAIRTFNNEKVTNTNYLRPFLTFTEPRKKKNTSQNE